MADAGVRRNCQEQLAMSKQLAREEKTYDRACHALSIELREDRAGGTAT